MFYVYVLQSLVDANFYTGYTENLERRFEEHNEKKVASTKYRTPFKLIYYEVCYNKKDALHREKYLKTTYGKRYIKNRLKNYLCNEIWLISFVFSRIEDIYFTGQEGYCRRNLKEYLNFLNFALGSSGELLSGMISLKEINTINDKQFEEFNEQHYKVENQLLSLIKSLQKKQKDGDWQDSFIEK